MSFVQHLSKHNDNKIPVTIDITFVKKTDEKIHTASIITSTLLICCFYREFMRHPIRGKESIWFPQKVFIGETAHS